MTGHERSAVHQCRSDLFGGSGALEPHLEIAGFTISRLSEFPMITLTIILLLMFVPASRRLLSRMLVSILAAIGIVFLVAPDSRPRRRGL